MESYSLLVLLVNLATKTFLVVDLVLQAVGVILEAVPGLNAFAGSLVFLSVLLGFLNHTLDFLSAQASFVISDGDRLRLAGSLVAGADPQDTVGVELKCDFDLRNTTRRRTKAR